ncbi:MAG TPA: hypothetical protein VGD80_05260 [Kofleriaceae bacterium]
MKKTILKTKLVLQKHTTRILVERDLNQAVAAADGPFTIRENYCPFDGTLIKP